MTYIKKSIPKDGSGPGTANAKMGEFIFIDLDSVLTEPTRESGTATYTGDLVLKETELATSIYITNETIEVTEEHTGATDGRGIIKGVKGSHPGDSVDIRNFTEETLNKAGILLFKEFTKGKWVVRKIGSLANPCYLELEYANNKTTRSRILSFKQKIADEFTIGDYSGKLPGVATSTVTPVAATNEGA